MTERFSLKWNDYQSNLTSALGVLKTANYLNDITLITDDHQQIKANKMVLSLSSDYFQSIFKNNQESKLSICLEGVTRQDLYNCLDYMYHGEVQLFQEDLDKFLKVAQRLQIKGLLRIDEDTKNEFEEQLGKHELIDNEENTSILDTIEESQVRTTSVTLNESSMSNKTDHTTTDEYIEKLDDGSWRCIVCGKVSTNKRKDNIMRQHVETHMEGITYSCPECNKAFRSKHSLAVHKSVYHNKSNK